MSDHHHHRATDNNARVSADRGALFMTVIHLWPYIWPSDRRDLKLRVLGAMVLLLAAKLATIAVPFTFKWATDALAGHGTAPAAGHRLAGVGAGRSRRHDDCLWRHAHPDGGAYATARRHLRQGGDARGAPARLPHLRAHARAVAALPSRAQDRRADPRARARPQRHRDHRADGDPATLAHHHRAGADRRRADVAIRLALRRGDHGRPSLSI